MAARAHRLQRIVSGFGLISDEASVRRQTVQHMKEAIKATADAGAKLIAGPLYVPSVICRVGAARVTSGGGPSRPIRNWGWCWRRTR